MHIAPERQTLVTAKVEREAGEVRCEGAAAAISGRARGGVPVVRIDQSRRDLAQGGGVRVSRTHGAAVRADSCVPALTSGGRGGPLARRPYWRLGSSASPADPGSDLVVLFVVWSPRLCPSPSPSAAAASTPGWCSVAATGPTDQPYVPPQRIGIDPLGDSEAAHAKVLVSAALEAFELDGYSVAGLKKHSNITARLVSVGSGPSLALRLRAGPPVDGRTEFAWLDAVRRGTTVRVVEPYADDFASNTRIVENPPGTFTECALFLWAEGAPLATALTSDNYRKLGIVSAQLHEFASQWAAPPDLKPLVWDRTMYYEGTSLVIADPRYTEFVSPSAAATVLEVVREADDELQRLASAPDRIFLHGNIEMWNVLVTASGALRLLDFEDVMFGSPVLDIAITLYYGRERTDYKALRRAYENGYRSVRPWPVRDSRQMSLLAAARAAMLLNHALQTVADKRAVIERLLPLILAAAR